MILFEFCPFTFSRLAAKPIKIDKNNILNKLIVFFLYNYFHGRYIFVFFFKFICFFDKLFCFLFNFRLFC